MSVHHGFIEPVFVDGQAAVAFKCPCGWTSTHVRPEVRGTLRLICTEYDGHQKAHRGQAAS